MVKLAFPAPVALLLLPVAGAAQEVADCAEPPSVAQLLEPWEETSAVLADGAVRLAAVDAGEGAVALVVLTLPPPSAPDAPEAEETPAAAAASRRCRRVTEGGLGFAGLDLQGVETEEDPAAGTFAARLPALRFVPESSELEEVTLSLTFGVADDALAAAIE